MAHSPTHSEKGDPVCEVKSGNVLMKVTVDSGSPIMIISDILFLKEWQGVELLPPDIRTVAFGGHDGLFHRKFAI